MNFRKYVLPSALVLLLAGGLAGAQTISKALQLSQDATGAFGVDTQNGVYFPGHILSPTSTTNRPLPSISGTGTPTLVGTDTAGLATFGTSGTTATIVFGTAYVTVPWCVVSWQSVAGAATPVGYTLATTSIALTQGAVTGSKVNYFCPSAS